MFFGHGYVTPSTIFLLVISPNLFSRIYYSNEYAHSHLTLHLHEW